MWAMGQNGWAMSLMTPPSARRFAPTMLTSSARRKARNVTNSLMKIVSRKAVFMQKRPRWSAQPMRPPQTSAETRKAKVTGGRPGRCCCAGAAAARGRGRRGGSGLSGGSVRRSRCCRGGGLRRGSRALPPARRAPFAVAAAPSRAALRPSPSALQAALSAAGAAVRARAWPAQANRNRRRRPPAPRASPAPGNHTRRKSPRVPAWPVPESRILRRRGQARGTRTRPRRGPAPEIRTRRRPGPASRTRHCRLHSPKDPQEPLPGTARGRSPPPPTASDPSSASPPDRASAECHQPP